MEINNNLKINEYVSIAQLKRKLKAYLAEQGNSDFKPSIFAQGLIVSLVMVLEELVSDCLKSVSKEKSGLYTINQLILSNLFTSTEKYEFVSRYMKKYSSTLRYHESIFFNFNKVITNLEDKHGSKLMVDSEAKNIIAYIVLSLQYDIVGLAVSMVKYAGRKTLNTNVLDIVCSYILSNDISSKIRLKLDSINIASGADDVDGDDGDDSDENNADGENNENNGENNSGVKLEQVQEVIPEPVKESETEPVPDVIQAEPVKEKKKKNKEVKTAEVKTEDVDVKETTSKIVKEEVVEQEKPAKKSKSKSK
jgi:hypothetical protein